MTGTIATDRRGSAGSTHLALQENTESGKGRREGVVYSGIQEVKSEGAGAV